MDVVSDICVGWHGYIVVIDRLLMPCCSQYMSCCKCCWHNFCGAFAGIGCNWGCCSCLLAPPAEMQYIRGKDCCKTGCCQGWGTICLCTGEVMCIPDWLTRWSIWHTVGEDRGKMFDIEIISIRAEYGNGLRDPIDNSMPSSR